MRGILSLFLLFEASTFAQNQPDWAKKSNENAQLLLNLTARYSPEGAASEGVAGLDDKITILTPDLQQRYRRDLTDVRKELEARLSAEQDQLVRQDLQILIDAAGRNLRSSEANERHLLPYMNVAAMVYSGVKSLLDDQVASERRPAAIARLRRYTGLEPGYTPFTTLAEKRFREKLQNRGLVGPPKSAVEKDLENTSTYVTEIGLLLEKYKLQGYQDAFSRLKEQLASYDDFVRKEVL